MESYKDGKGSSNPKIHLDQELLIALAKSAMIHMVRVGQEYDIWAEKSVKTFGNKVEPYLYHAWKLAEHLHTIKPISLKHDLKTKISLFLSIREIINIKSVGIKRLSIFIGSVCSFLSMLFMLFNVYEINKKVLLVIGITTVISFLIPFFLVRAFGWVIAGFKEDRTKTKPLENFKEVKDAKNTVDETREYEGVKLPSSTGKRLEVCSLTNQECDYYDSKDDACYYGKEGSESWRNKICPKNSLTS